MLRRIVAFALLSFSFSVSAQSPVVVEAIEVDGVAGIPDEIVIAETRLEPGRTYSPAQIDQAVNRVRRMPVVLRASHRLEEGSKPDSRRLVIIIEPVKRLHAALEAEVRRADGDTFGLARPNAAYRAFLGSDSLEFIVGAPSTSDDGGDFRDATLRYTNYNVLGTGALLEFSMTEILYSGDTTHDSSPSARVVVPLTLLQSVRARYATSGQRNEFAIGPASLPASSSFDLSQAEVFWVRETTDDAWCARRGSVLSIGPVWSLFDSRNPRLTGGEVVYARNTQRSVGLLAVAERFLPLTQTTTLRLHSELEGSRTRNRSSVRDRSATQLRAEGMVTASFDFGAAHRQRLEAGVASVARRARTLGTDSSDSDFGLVLGYTYRHPRFSMRLTGMWLDAADR